MISRPRPACLGLALLAACLAGCNPSLVKVKGKLLKNGAPMVVSKDTYVTLSFIPELGESTKTEARSYSATFDQTSGTYTVDLPSGKYRVMLVMAPPPKKAGGVSAPLPPYKPDQVYDLTKNQDLDIEVPGK